MKGTAVWQQWISKGSSRLSDIFSQEEGVNQDDHSSDERAV